MNVNSIYGNLASSTVAGATAAATTATSSSTVTPWWDTGASSSSSISTPAQFFSEMQQLAQQNPSEFKTVAAEVATTFQNAASKATGQQAQVLTHLANMFTQAAQTGTLQAPQAGGSAAPHHHHHGGSGQSGAIQQAFESAMSILEQATQATSSTAAATATSTTTT
jgi:hypothetical protein